MDKKTQKQKQIDNASTQEHIPIATAKDGILVMKDGGMRVVLLVNAINFSLKSEEEQNAIVYQYQSFINSLNFPIQIVVQSRIMDLGTYLKTMRELMQKQTNELLLDVTESYIDFVEELIEKSSIMSKRFYVVIPISPITSGLPVKEAQKILNANKKKNIEIKYSDKDFIHYAQELNEKTQTVIAGLSSIGLQAIPLNTQQLIELYYNSYNPEESMSEKLTAVEDLDAPVVMENPEDAAEQVVAGQMQNEKDQGQPIAENFTPQTNPNQNKAPNPIANPAQSPAPSSTVENPTPVSTPSPAPASVPTDNIAQTPAQPSPINQPIQNPSVPKPTNPTQIPITNNTAPAQTPTNNQTPVNSQAVDLNNPVNELPTDPTNIQASDQPQSESSQAPNPAQPQPQSQNSAPNSSQNQNNNPSQ